MKIISKHKDFYDWCSSIFGIDEKAIFDRRGTETNQILVLEKALRETPLLSLRLIQSKPFEGWKILE